MPFWTYVGAVKPCSDRALPGSKNVQMALLERFDRSFDFGILNCRASTSNAAVMSIHSDGRAGDLGFPVVNGQPHAQGFEAVEILRTHGLALGVMGLIWYGQRYDWRTPWGRKYTGPNPHVDHVHWEQHPDLARTLTADTAYRLIGDPPMAFTPQEETALKALAPYSTFLVDLAKAIRAPGPTTAKVGTGQSLLHVLEVHRLVAEDAAVSGLDHLAIKAHLLGQ